MNGLFTGILISLLKNQRPRHVRRFVATEAHAEDHNGHTSNVRETDVDFRAVLCDTGTDVNCQGNLNRRDSRHSLLKNTDHAAHMYSAKQARKTPLHKSRDLHVKATQSKPGETGSLRKDTEYYPSLSSFLCAGTLKAEKSEDIASSTDSQRSDRESGMEHESYCT